jgi:tetratricopeptide (TPR) repeat protein
MALAMILALGAVVAPRWLGHERNSAEPHVRAAHRALTQGRLDEAAAELAEARQQDEPSTEVERLWGLLYGRAGRADDALPLLQRAWDGPGSEGRGPDPEVAEALARIAMQRFDFANAIQVLDRWAGQAPNDPKPLVMRSEIDRRIGVERIVTIGHLREALRRDPTCDEARLSLAEILYIDGQYAESSEHYAAYAARHPDNAAGHVGVGIAARVQGEVAKAVAALDLALVLAPDDTLALRERAAIDLHAGHADDALRRLDRAIKADPFDPELRYQRSLALGQLGRRDEAVAERRASEQLRREHAKMAEIANQLINQPADNTLRCLAARWMIDHGRVEEAVQWAQLVLRNQPDHPEANRLLADYHQRRGELGLANFHRLHAVAAPEPAATQTSTGDDRDR